MTSPSQYGDDVFILENYFANLPNEWKTAPVVEIGSNDGWTLSNTYLFSQLHGNQRFLLDASPEAKKWHSRRQLPGDIFTHAAIVGNDDPRQTVTLHESRQHCGNLPDINYGLVSTIIPEEKKRWGKSETFYEKTVPAIKVKHYEELIREHMKTGPAYQRVLLLSIDVEGMDWQVLKDWNFANVLPAFVIIEWANKPDLKSRMVEHMTAEGYELIRENSDNLTFKLADKYL